MCSAESEVIHGNLRIPKNEASQELEKNEMHNLVRAGAVPGQGTKVAHKPMLGMTPSHGRHITGNYATLGYNTFSVLVSFLFGVQVQGGVSVLDGGCAGDAPDRPPLTQWWGALNLPSDLSHSGQVGQLFESEGCLGCMELTQVSFWHHTHLPPHLVQFLVVSVGRHPAEQCSAVKSSKSQGPVGDLIGTMDRP